MDEGKGEEGVESLIIMREVVVGETPKRRKDSAICVVVSWDWYNSEFMKGK